MRLETTPTAQHINAITSAMGGLAMAIALQLSPQQRAGLANDLTRLAVNAENQGDTLLETLFIDLQRAVR